MGRQLRLHRSKKEQHEKEHRRSNRSVRDHADAAIRARRCHHLAREPTPVHPDLRATNLGGHRSYGDRDRRRGNHSSYRSLGRRR